MASDRIWEDLMDLSIRCGTNQRYDQILLTVADTKALRIDVAVVVTTMLCLVIGCFALLLPDKKLSIWFKRCDGTRPGIRLDVLALSTSVLSAIAGLVLIVSAPSRDVRHYGNMFQSWSDLRQDVDSVLADADAEKPPGGELEQQYIERRYRELLAKKNALNAREPAPDEALFERCMVAEENSRRNTQLPASAKPAKATANAVPATRTPVASR